MPQNSNRVLYVANRLPWPLDDGWKRRAYAILVGLAEFGDVTMVSPAPEDPDLVDELRARLPANVQLAPSAPGPGPQNLLVGAILSLLTGRSPLSIRQYSRRLAKKVLETAHRQSFDVVVYAGAFLSELHTSSPVTRPLPFVVDTHNIDSFAIGRRAEELPPLEAMAFRAVARKIARAERRVFGEARCVLVCSADEIRLVEQINPAARIAVVPNGVDLNDFPSHQPPPLGEALQLLFFGHLEYQPNSDGLDWLAREIIPALDASSVPYKLRIVGAGNAALTRTRFALCARVEVIGRVDDIAREISQCHAVLVPLRMGGGTRFKVLEAMACGRVAISTRIGAEGIKTTDGVDVLYAEDPAEFASAIERLWKAPELIERLGTAAAALVQRRYAWQIVYGSLKQALGSSPPP